MATQQFPTPDNKNATWLFLWPILIIAILAVVNMSLFYFAAQKNQNKEVARNEETLMEQQRLAQPNVDTAVIVNAAIAKYKAQQDSMSKLKKPLVVQDTAYLYGIPGPDGRRRENMYLLRGDTIWDYEFQVNDNVFIKCKGKDRDGYPYDDWIRSKDISNTLNPIDTPIDIEHSHGLSHPKYQVAPKD